MIRRLLIANRGEIACRVIRSCQRLGIHSVAVYSAADAHARHVRLADEAVAIGPAPASESYLCIERIVAAAKQTGAGAIHPGYGFLAENADFARACLDAGLIFVGPSPETIAEMGSKRRARQLMKAAGVPVVPGYDQEEQDDGALLAAAQEIGVPIMIKPSAGGGGKGMRVVRELAALESALAAARRESRAAFGDDRLILERLVERPRHVEVQIFADNHGNVVHLFERECSIQRRYQKIIEESPAPSLSEALRERMFDAAIAAARAVDYRNAGTVEFLVEGDDFYFMEMNTRLQVEHPVTEAVTGLDLVEWQLRVAAGEPLPAAQQQIVRRGHAIEARIYAENPFEGFLPSTGTIGRFVHPPTGTGLRIDGGVEDGDEVTIHYDPMIAKLIVLAADRDAAVVALRRALARTLITGPATNMALLRSIAAYPDFAAGAMDTGYLDRHLDAVIDALPRPHEVALAAAAAARFIRADRHPAHATDPHSPWDIHDGWRPGGGGVRLLFADDCGGRYEVFATGRDGRYRMTIGERRHAVTATPAGGDRLQLRVDDGDYSATVVTAKDELYVGLDSGGYELTRLPLYASAGDAEEDTHPGAPMPGRIVALYVAAGDEVEAGQPLLVLEGMKMEFTLTAPAAGVISRIRCAQGDMVEAETPLVDIEPPSGGRTGEA
jgi:3-methylcrotonyl-CoA carboxylase alpha subunit